MKEWPEFNESGDLPVGIHQASLAEVIDHFGRGSFQRAIVAQRLERIYSLASQTGKVKGEAAIIFNHMPAQNYEGASIFWVRSMAAFGGEDNAISFWQGKRNGERRGIVEVISND